MNRSTHDTVDAGNGATSTEIDLSNGTIYVFAPPEDASHNTVLEPGDLCFATGVAEDGDIHLGALRNASGIEEGTYVGWAEPTCLRLASDEERAGVTIPELEERVDCTMVCRVYNDPRGYGKIFNGNAEVPDGWTDSGFSGTHSQCVKYLGF